MRQITLEWTEAGHKITHKLVIQQTSKHPGRFRLGRNPELCDLVFTEDNKISRLHAEIFFNSNQNRFYLRKLSEGLRPPIVDGEIITEGEIALRQGSSILLGETEIKVVAVVIDPAYLLICPNLKCGNPDPRRAVDAKLQFCPWCGTFLVGGNTLYDSK
ncbi:peptide-binding protein [Fischerella thermalis CCMEE 5268]|uniref:Peptide-binding protein n=1 Tax=Fischerella thermalis CCMEE 5268 TaxID=2019662 RepID=A0A2N6KKB7_9CYAN|nr:FHA domain-containing protein [Fischerella thermalis]PMB00105.1 peptide-binding protein [Fischerella thermalis CCMEE 5268]